MGKRWLGRKHSRYVKKNPLHYTTAIESCERCIRCDAVLHRSAFETPSGRKTSICAECLREVFEHHPEPGRLP